MIKRILLSLGIIISLLVLPLLVPTIALAQTQGRPSGQWWDQSFIQFTEKVNDKNNANEIFGERYTRAQVNWIILSLIDLLAGKVAKCSGAADIVACFQEAFTSDGSLGTIPTLAMGVDTLLSQRPASGIDYIASSIRNFRIIPEATAQGYGFQKSLVPIQKMWTITRNASYALLTLAVIILGFMIMFRAKISPQASVTVQSAIPRVVVGMIFITFSYAIGGFIIDLGFLLLGLFAALVTSVPGVTNVNAVNIFNSLNDGVQTVFGYALAFIIESFSGGGILAKLTRNADTSGGGIASIVSIPFRGVDTLLALVIMLLLVFALIRLFWTLLRTYVVTILAIAAAPLVGVAYIANPAGNMIGAWFKTLFANMAVFVSISILIMAAHLFFYGMGNADFAGNPALAFINPNPFGIEAFAADAGVGRFPGGFGFENTKAIGFFVSLVLILSIPGIANQIRSYITTGKAAFGFDSAGAILGGSVGGAAAGLGATAFDPGLSRIETTARNLGVSPFSLRGGVGEKYTRNKVVQGLLSRMSRMK